MSLRANGGAMMSDLALQQVLDEFDGYKKMMSAQNRDIIKTNVFGQSRIRHLEDQITALEEKITLQAAARTRAEARAQQLEHELSCIHTAFDFLSKTVSSHRNAEQRDSVEERRRNGGMSPPMMPLPPAHAKPNAIKVDQSNLLAGVVRPVARPPAFALGKIQEEHQAAPPPASPDRMIQLHQFTFGSQMDEHGSLLYPPLPSPTVTDNSSAPSPVRTPDLEFPLTLPLRLPGSSSSALAGLNIRIEPSDADGTDVFQPLRTSRPALVRSDTTSSWTVKTPVQTSPELPQGAEDTSNASSSKANVDTSTVRVVARKRMQGRNSALLSAPPSAPSTIIATSQRPSIVGPSSPWSGISADEKGKRRSTSESSEETTRVVLSDTSNIPYIHREDAQAAKSGILKSSTLVVSVDGVARKQDGAHGHVDTPVLRPHFELPRTDSQGSSEGRRSPVRSDDESEQNDDLAAQGGRPTRRARSSVNYALPKLNTKMRKPDNESSALQAAAKVSALRPASASGSLSRRTSANAALRTAAMTVASQSKRHSTAAGSTALKSQLSPAQHARSRSRSSSSDVSIMSFTSGSSATPLMRSPNLPEHTEQVERRNAFLDASVAMNKQDSEGTASPSVDAEQDRSAGSTTIVPTEPSASSSDPVLPAEEHERSAARPTRRSSAAVSYALPKLNTKMRKPEPSSEGPAARRSTSGKPAVSRSNPTSALSTKKTRASRGKDSTDMGTDDEGEEDADSDDQDSDDGHAPQHGVDSESANVSANIAHYSSRTLRKSVVPNYALPKLNTKMRKPDEANGSVRGRSASAEMVFRAPGTLAGGELGLAASAGVMESPKRKATRRSASTDNLAGSALSASRATSIPNETPKTWSRATSASANGAPLGGPASTSFGMSGLSPTAISPRTSLHAMLTTTHQLSAAHHHPARERSGSSTSSGSTVRAAGNAGGFGAEGFALSRNSSWAEDDDDAEEEGQEDGGADEHEGQDASGSETGEESDDESYSPSSPPVQHGHDMGEDVAGEEGMDYVGGDGGDDDDDDDGDFGYDDRMDPLLFSDSPFRSSGAEPVTPARKHRQRGNQGAADDGEAAEAADSTAGGASALAVGSASFDSSLSGYDSTAILG
ncbi:hypothetical protein OC842_001195 [Tilletia horrida]|uniref:Shugoshin C-terminal domain-containing protein n=1 Tax=Tilletia horrida TaxID=155126 RepID=A0AAN6GI08_9BASI|nr:hypothetical protein OC842_001195 [Tilletia horrida]